MTARVLVVDDIKANVKLLEARLMAEYFQVITASNGPDALTICENGECDMVLLDVMMPGMDGFEICRRLKRSPNTAHLPVVMVTALDQPEDRVKGLDSGADDFLSKPVNDLALVTRVRSLVRLKLLTDELRLRASTGRDFGVEQLIDTRSEAAMRPRGHLLVVDDKSSSYEKLVRLLSREHDVQVITAPQDALFQAAEGNFDCLILSMEIDDFDGLRLCSQLRSLERTRMMPIVIYCNSEDDQMIIRGLDIGVNDFLVRPFDQHELMARVRTQIRRKRYNDQLRNSVQETMELAIRDGLTGLHNRRYMDTHISSLFDKAVARRKPFSVIITDIDYFKAVNDNHGHIVGDEVLKEFSRRLQRNIRNIDLACRYGGEEFVVVMPDTDIAFARVVAERIRTEIAIHPFVVSNGAKQVPITISLGVASLSPGDKRADFLIKRADDALYAAKNAGRNRVMIEAA